MVTSYINNDCRYLYFVYQLFSTKPATCFFYNQLVFNCFKSDYFTCISWQCQSVFYCLILSKKVTTQRPPPPTTSVPTDLRVNTTALNAVALSSVAKYWVLTNLLPGPIPQVSVYGIPTTARTENGGKVLNPEVRLKENKINSEFFLSYKNRKEY